MVTFTRKPSTESIILPEDGSNTTLTDTLQFANIDTRSTRHRYNTRLSARLSSLSNSRLLLTATPSRVSNCSVNPENCRRRGGGDLGGLVVFDKNKNMDWSGDRFCRPSPIYIWSKYIFAAICIGIVGMAVAYVNQKLKESFAAFGQVKDDLANIQNEMNAMREEVQKAINSKADSTENLSKIEKYLESIKDNKKSQEVISEHGTLDEKSEIFNSDASKQEGLEDAVMKVLEQYNADKTGRTDFALESAGGTIISSRNTENYHGDSKFHLLGFKICEGSNGPRAMIQAGALPGECWAIKGTSGAVVIRLLGKVFITGVSLEHIPKALSPTGEISSAPKEFSLWGLNDPYDMEGQFFGQFVYESEGPSIQYFDVDSGSKSYNYIEFKVHSNHGNPDYTCVYRLRVHGQLEAMRRGGKL